MPKQRPSRTVVIDLGSNSFRLVAYDYVPERWWRRSDEIYDGVRIGAGMLANGALSEERMEGALEVLDVYAHFCLAAGMPLSDVTAVATSAIRDATNGAEFVERVRQRTKLAVRIVSAHEEAYYAYLAAVNSTTLTDGAVLDLGGGSLQLVHVESRRALETSSWPLGTVRMTERFFPDKRASAKQLNALREHVLEELRKARWLERLEGMIVGMGGTARNLASAAATAAERAGLGVHGYVLSRTALGELVEQLAKRTEAERAQMPGIKPERAGVILAGAIVIATVMDASGLEQLQVTEAGLREGIFFSFYLAGHDPPLFEDVRRASVWNLAHQYQGDLAHSCHVARVAGQLWSSLASLGATPSSDLDAETILWAAAMLHDIGMAIDYDDHHKHSRYLLLAAGLPGYSQREQALIAQAVRYHRKGTPDLGALGALCEPGDERLLAAIAAVLALAEYLDRSRDGAIEVAGVQSDNGSLQLELEVARRGDDVLARWGVERQSDLFRRAFGRPLTLA
jgi:exopolyphosphatase/guanosine-5'-triphosphate,3'-diphosphate pyrophosphatase